MHSVLKNIFRLRILVAAAVFILISCYFLDLHHTLPKPFYQLGAIKLEIAPALCKWIAAGTVATSFVAFSVLALFFGRIYCACFCPFGILSDLSRFCARLFFKIPPFKNSTKLKNLRLKLSALPFAKARNFLRATCLALAIVFYAAGFSALFGLLEPYSLFGKIASDFFRPAALFFNDILHSIFGASLVSKVEDPSVVSLGAFLLGTLLFIAIFAASILRGRIFCNTLCPVGAWLGFLSKFSLFKLKLGDACLACGKCAKNCRAQCIDFKNKKLDFTRCVMCGDCLKGCPKSAVKLEFAYKNLFAGAKGKAQAESAAKANFEVNPGGEKFLKPKANLEKQKQKNPSKLESPEAPQISAQNCNAANFGRQISRKTFAKTLLAGSAAFALAAKSESEKKLYCVPAGSGGIEEFLSRCTACGLCIASCKGNVLQPSISQWGLRGFMVPYMDHSTGYCRDDCHNCTKVCPSGAISFLSKKQKLQIKIGLSEIDYGKCLVTSQGKECTVCLDACPQKAIEWRPRGNSRRPKFPKVRKGLCIGCGKCAYLCPTEPKAISILPFEKHIAIQESCLENKNFPAQGKN